LKKKQEDARVYRVTVVSPETGRRRSSLPADRGNELKKNKNNEIAIQQQQLNFRFLFFSNSVAEFGYSEPTS
jgi:hypothetical protein